MSDVKLKKMPTNDGLRYVIHYTHDSETEHFVYVSLEEAKIRARLLRAKQQKTRTREVAHEHLHKLKETLKQANAQ